MTPDGWGPTPWGPPWRRRPWRRRRRWWVVLPGIWLWLGLFWAVAGWLWHGRSGPAHGPWPAASILVFAALVAGSAAAAWVTASFSRRLERLRTGVDELNLRDLDVRVPVEGSGAVAALARAFNAMIDRLAAEERVRRQLFADVAHELRHPLAVLKARLEAVQDGALPLNEEQVLNLQDMVIGLTRLVDDLRDLSLADVGQLSLALGPVDLAVLAGEVAESLAPLAEDRGIALAAPATTGPVSIRADRDRLRQVLVNLLTNALRHTPAGGQVGVSVRAEGSGAVLEVWDTGVGIAPRDLPHVFERFYRADPARARSGGGSGLGLTIVQSIVRLHGGSVSVRSPDAAGRGTRFTVRLPVGDPAGPR